MSTGTSLEEPSPPKGGSLARWVRERSQKKVGPREPGPPGPWVVLAAWGPCGFLPLAPGTFGTLGAVPLAWAAARLPIIGQLALILVVTFLGKSAALRAGRYWGVCDASQIVIDEVAGYLVTMLGIPFTFPAALAGFVLFRAFDVLKPWPASYFDRQHSAWSVMLDDVAAGVWALATLRILGAVLVHTKGCAGAPFYCGF